MKILKALVITALFAATAMAQDMAMTGATWNIGLASGKLVWIHYGVNLAQIIYITKNPSM